MMVMKEIITTIIKQRDLSMEAISNGEENTQCLAFYSYHAFVYFPIIQNR
jgi:hypothetical protein